MKMAYYKRSKPRTLSKVKLLMLSLHCIILVDPPYLAIFRV